MNDSKEIYKLDNFENLKNLDPVIEEKNLVNMPTKPREICPICGGVLIPEGHCRHCEICGWEACFIW